MHKLALVLILVLGPMLMLGSWQYGVWQKKFSQAEEFFELGRDEQALKVLEEVEDDFFFREVIERVISRMPSRWQPDFYWKLKYNKGVAFSGLGQEAFSDAERFFYQVADRAPLNKFRKLKADAYFQLSVIYLHRKDGADQAIQYLEEALRLEPSHWQAKYNLEWLQKSGKGDQKEGRGQKGRELLRRQTKQLQQENGKGESKK